MFKSTLAAIALLLALGSAHMIMLTPTPFNNATIDNSPLSSSGSDFPCKSTGANANFYDRTGISNVMAIGEKQTLSFKGSAVHGGGSCQLAITTDKSPTPSTTWQVIQSIEGGCPSKDGNGPSTYDFAIPEGVAAGDYIFAWTWISKLAGQPEYYMNCAPITVSGGSKKRSEDSALVKRASFPNLAVFNLASVNSCKTSPGTDPVYPDPGANVVKPGASPSYATPAGTNCFPIGGTGDSSSGNDTTGAAPANSAPAASPVGTTPTTSANNGLYTPETGAATGTAGAGGIFAPGASSAATTLSPVVATTPATTAAVATSAVQSVPAAITTPSTGSSASNSTTSGALNGPCTAEGMYNCLSGTSFQRCASGAWSVAMAMPAGTSCTPGQSQTLFARSMRVVRRNALGFQVLN